MKELGRRLVRQEGLPRFEPVELTLDMLLAEGARQGGAGGRLLAAAARPCSLVPFPGCKHGRRRCSSAARRAIRRLPAPPRLPSRNAQAGAWCRSRSW